MSVTVGVNERLRELTAAGTSVWLDQIRRSMIEGGELQRLIDEYSLRGVTSNPAIFEKAILGSADYDDQIVELEADKRSEAAGAPEERPGQAGVLNVRAGAVRYKRMFHGERFARLREAGAPLQRPLWASTGVKNPRSPDTLYVEELVAPETV